MSCGKIVQVNVSAGGVPKLPVERAMVGPLGIEGDEHRYRMHGGPRKALLLIASEVIHSLCSEGWPLFYGALGENLTTQDLDHRAWRAGQRFRCGDLILQLTEPRAPCKTLNPYGAGIQSRIYDKQVKAHDPTSAHWGESGFYAAVLNPGVVQPNDIIRQLDPVV